MAKCKSEKSISPGERQLVGARGLRNQIQGIRGKIRNVYATVAADLGSSRKVSRSGDDLFQVQHPCVLTEVSLLELLTQRQCPAAGDGLAKAFAKNRKFGSLTGTRAAFPGCRGGWFRAASSWGGLASPRLPHRPRASRAERALRLLLSQTVASWGRVRSSSSERTGAKRGTLSV
jgi:hypothetical protein